MDDLVRWLGEQFDADEQEARRGYLKAEPIPDYDGWDDSTTAGVPPAVAARVLREIDAKRQIIRLHEITVEKIRVAPFDSYTGERNPDEYDVTCAICGWVSDDRTSACLTLRLLALPYADREGYRAEWAPTT